MSHFLLLLEVALCAILVIIAIDGLRQVRFRDHPVLSASFIFIALAAFGVLTLVLKVGCLPVWTLPLQAFAMFYSTRLLGAAHVRLRGVQGVEGSTIRAVGPREVHR